ncbi:MAG: phosphoribosylformylglycinamidine cyclo-ligase [Candidatus Eisenbacteria bacterium]|nr:phosphoribosylformylglycinamidine cyclo-ligase [Candidatus Eisenbacteria bacterium]
MRNKNEKRSLSYAQAGVSIERAEEALKRIKSHVLSTLDPHSIGKPGLFSGFFEVPSGYKEPVLLSTTDGVGTKLLIAKEMNCYDSIGVDLVNHCANDILVHGGKPMFFLDYVGTGKLNPEVVEKIISGMAKACRTAGVSLIGGELAEMPGLYRDADFDLVGTMVGIAEKSSIVDGSQIQEGDLVIGLSSNGIHTNGFSLVRKVLLQSRRFTLNQMIPELGSELGKELLKPHKLYMNEVVECLRTGYVRGMAHITGGGLPGNIVRILPKNVDAIIRRGAWKMPAIFSLVERKGSVSKKEMLKTFNLGIGFVMVIAEKGNAEILKALDSTRSAETKTDGRDSFEIGEIVRGGGKVIMEESAEDCS